MRAELHVHTVLSPCAEVEMIPPLIVQEALELGLELIAITDHNASANIAAVRKAAEGTPLTVLPGMELQTREEVHLLCLFDTLEQIGEWQALVSAALPSIPNDPDHFGGQFVVDETGDFIRHEDQLLLVSADLGLDEAILEVTRRGGLAIPAHVNRRANGLIANLGFVPTGVPIEALEISRHLTPEQACRQFPQLASFPLIRSGDAHRLSELLGVNEFTIQAPTIAELRLALAHKDGRSYRILA